MIDLSDDERTVLMICERDEGIAAIGRWEQPIERLLALGLLQRRDKFNNFITEAGRKAIGEANDAVDDTFARAIIGAHNARVQYRNMGEEVANGLAVMVTESAAATGDNLDVAMSRCVAAVRKRALEILRAK